MIARRAIQAISCSGRRYLRADQLVFVDYYTALKDAEGGMRAELSNEGVHPNRNGYALMRPLAEQAIAWARRSRSP
jgi:lysophospholipase L1-like esterase